MTDELVLWRAILDEPDDESLRLVYADWLEEHGDPNRAEFIRAQIELDRLPQSDQRRAEVKGRALLLLNRLMVQVDWGSYHLLGDPLTTRLGYIRIAAGSAEGCGCQQCRNFTAARDQAYPAEALTLLQRLGIDHRREAEVYHCCPLPSGLHLYQGWFHFVGVIEEGMGIRVLSRNAVQTVYQSVTETFCVAFVEGSALLRLPCPDLPLVQLEFETHVPWVLEEPEPA